MVGRAWRLAHAAGLQRRNRCIFLPTSARAAVLGEDAIPAGADGAENLDFILTHLLNQGSVVRECLGIDQTFTVEFVQIAHPLALAIFGESGLDFAIFQDQMPCAIGGDHIVVDERVHEELVDWGSASRRS